MQTGNTLCLVAERTGLEPATTGVTGQYSNQLNYRSIKIYTPKKYALQKREDFGHPALVGVAGVEPATYGL